MKRIVGIACLATFAGVAAAQECRIEYQRADNMWAAPGRPDGPLGTETLTLKPGERKVFITDWKYEKRRNDGTNYYGSHVRVMRNTGQAPVGLVMNGAQGLPGAVAGGAAGGAGGQVIGRAINGLKPGQLANDLRADLAEVRCEAATGGTRPGGQTPGGSANPAQSAAMQPPMGLNARQNSPNDIVLDWQPVPGAKEYRVYVDPPAQPHLAGKPTVVGGTGGHFVIPIPRNVAPGTVYRASIEAVGTNGAVSPRAAFNPVPVQATGGGPTAGGPGTSPPTGGTSGGGGQQCPPGQFMTGISPSGSIVCAPR